MAGFCEYRNEPSGSINGWKFLDEVRNCNIVNRSHRNLLHGVRELCFSR
jgi:hypothetical protein